MQNIYIEDTPLVSQTDDVQKPPDIKHALNIQYQQ